MGREVQKGIGEGEKHDQNVLKKINKTKGRKAYELINAKLRTKKDPKRPITQKMFLDKMIQIMNLLTFLCK